MSRLSGERTVRPSVLDRLLDDERWETTDVSLSLAESRKRFQDSVLRDLGWILNTRRTTLPATRTHPEVLESVYQFGIPDVTSLSADSRDARTFLLAQVAEAIRVFEPRLVDVELSLVDDPGAGARSVRLRVEATLLMDPDPERIVFDTVLETASGAFAVET
jgi:type VI secretion system protein ImpF